MSNFSQFGGGGIKSIQRGVIAIGGALTSATATISTVNTAKTTLSFLGFSNGSPNGTSSISGNEIRIALTGATVITATRDFASAQAGNVSWEAIEWY